MIDLRSDTITKPTNAMRKVIAEAEVGDDVYGEDPCVNSLEAMAADMMGMEKAVFATSGTQANLFSRKKGLIHCKYSAPLDLQQIKVYTLSLCLIK